MFKLELEKSIRQSDHFICECYDVDMGDDTPDRVVTVDELLEHLDCTGNNEIPWDIGHRYIYLDLDEWIQMVGIQHLNWELERIINKRENRTETAPSTLPTTDLLPKLKGKGFMANIQRPE